MQCDINHGCSGDSHKEQIMEQPITKIVLVLEAEGKVSLIKGALEGGQDDGTFLGR